MTYYCFDVFNPLFLSLWSSQCTAPFGESKKWVSPKDTTHSFAGRTAHAGCAISSLHLEAGPFSFEFLQNTPLCTPPPQCPFGPELFLKLCTCLFSLTKTGLGAPQVAGVLWGFYAPFQLQIKFWDRIFPLVRHLVQFGHWYRGRLRDLSHPILQPLCYRVSWCQPSQSPLKVYRVVITAIKASGKSF